MSGKHRSNVGPPYTGIRFILQRDPVNSVYLSARISFGSISQHRIRLYKTTGFALS